MARSLKVARPRRHVDSLEARDVLARVERRHTRDVWFSEVKDGPTWFGGHLRIDGLAIAKTWSPPRITGYEVKVSRNDWLRDQKFEAYLPLCHVLFVVSANDAVHVDELPEGVGLIEAVGPKGLRTARKAAYRQIDLPGDMLLYLLMSRIRVSREHEGMSRESRLSMWEERLASDKRGRDIGYSVRKEIRERLDALEKGGGKLGAEYIVTVDAWLKEHGFDRWGDLRSRLDATLAAEAETIKMARTELERAAQRVAELLAAAPAQAPTGGTER